MQLPRSLYDANIRGLGEPVQTNSIDTIEPMDRGVELTSCVVIISRRSPPLILLDITI